MIKITKTNWRPFIELTTATEDEATVYFDVNRRPLIIQTATGTILDLGQDGSVLVKESAKDIIKAVDKLIATEQERKAKQAEEYMLATQARVAETAKALGDK